ncbi:MAG: hypothetical protein BA864_14330 [Desulfuromonadales bacterium C00003093]|nr:MAG: hypothetical protein BA864_14330 [Desulfuromonadales bacterium C00003093]
MESLKTVVVENTRSCNLRCKICPTVYARNFPAGFMDMETFHMILDHISPTIFPECALMGWGEPFLDPKYFDKLDHLKRTGYAVGSATNATLLTRDLILGLQDSGLDLLNVSIDLFHIKAAKVTLDELIGRLLSALTSLSEQQISFKIGVTVVLGKNALGFLPILLERLQDLPVFHIGVIPFIMIPSEECFSDLAKAEDMLRLKQVTDEKFPSLNVEFQYLDEPPSGNCRSDVFRNVWITYEGEVAPCCTLAMEFPNYTFDGQRYQTRLLSFGSLIETAFQDIWTSASYVAFRNSFRAGDIPPVCRCCNAWQRLPAK